MYSNRWDSDFDNWRDGEYEEEEDEDEIDEDAYYPTKKNKWSKYKTKL